MQMNTSRNRKMVAFLMSLVLMCGLLFQSIEGLAYEQKSGTIKSSSGVDVNVRKDAGTSYSVVTKLSPGTTVTVINEKKASDGHTWYQISFKLSGQTTTGWVRDDLITISVKVVKDEEFEAYLTEQKFPKTYKTKLRELHTLYPNWVFVAQHTGLKWSDVIAEEGKLGRNLVHNSALSSWKSTQTGAYNWDTSAWMEFDSGGWVAASEEIIAYYMDPRNLLDTKNVFQFLTQSYDSATQNKTGVKNVVKGTFLANTYKEGGEDIAYSTTLIKAAKASGVSPYVLASMIIMEQGATGYGNSISGTVAGYKGYYNFFNIGAYKTSTMSAVERGLWYAKGSGVGATSYRRPWNNRTDSIIGGAIYYGESYVKQGQDTLYLKKYNVQGNNPYTHQYMTNVAGAAGEAARLANAFSETSRKATLTFKIPVYKSMPSSPCPQPTGDGNPNYMLQSLSVSGYSLTPTFSKYTTSYSLIVPHEVSSVKIAAKAVHSKAKVSGTGTVSLSVGTNKKTIKVKAENGTTKSYVINIVREAKELDYSPTLTSSTYKVDPKKKTITNITTFPIKASSFKKKFKVANGSIKIFGLDGKTLSGNVGTGVKVKLYDENDELDSTYKVILYGDTNGDGIVNALDLLRVQKHILGVSKLTSVNMTAADTSKNGKIDALDLLQVQKHIIGKGTIKQ